MTATLIAGIAELVTNDELLDGADQTERLGRLSDAAVVVEDGVIAWVGPSVNAPQADERRDIGGRAVVPGFVDSHSHLVFAGDRSAEFAARMAGVRYDGGGIASSVNATRAAGDEELRALVGARVAEMRAQGTTTAKACSLCGSQNTSIQRAWGAQAESISPMISSTYSDRLSANSGGTTWAPRNVVSGVNSPAMRSDRSSSLTLSP